MQSNKLTNRVHELRFGVPSGIDQSRENVKKRMSDEGGRELEKTNFKIFFLYALGKPFRIEKTRISVDF